MCRICFLTFFLCVIYPVIANGDCAPLGDPTHGNDCNNYHPLGGYYWANGNCDNICPPGHYCPPASGEAKCCPEPFTETVLFDIYGNISGYTGATSLGNCYAKPSCGGTNVYIGCGNHWDVSNGKCPPPPQQGTTKPDVQWSYNYTNTANSPLVHKTRSNWADETYLEISDPGNVLDDTYHIEVCAKYKQHPQQSLGQWFWDEDSIADIKCVSNNVSCTTFAQGISSAETCMQQTTQSGCNNIAPEYNCVWVSENNINKCVYRDDIGATRANAHCSANASFSGYAHWQSIDDMNNGQYRGYWDISECKCIEPNNILDEERNCYSGGGTLDAIQETNHEAGNINPVHSVWEHVIFSSSNFFCTKCKAGPYYANYLPGLRKVESCTLLPDDQNHGKGYWRKPYQDKYCNDNNNSGVFWSVADYSTGALDIAPENREGPCAIQACDAGKTTDDWGPIGSNACHYSDQTQFCDARGCFNIPDAANNAIWNWSN